MNALKKILVVDDEPLNINILVELLKGKYKMMAAKSGLQALKAARSSNKPDLILLDIMMPDMDGYEVCRQLKEDEKTKDIPIIFVSAMSEDMDETKGFDVGAIDYITKPISPKTLESRVHTHLALTQQAVELREAHALIQQQQQRMQDELNVARDIQLSMVPTTFPQDEAIEVYATLKPAREIGGDFYDAFMIDSESLCLCVGDVSGKGAPAALFMAMTKTLIKSYASSDFSTASIMTRVNDELCEGNDENLFVTVFLAILNIHTGELRFTNAGHNYPYLIRENKSLLTLNQKHGPIVAAMDGLVYKEDLITLEKFDTLFLYTDGVTEAMNPEEELYGEKRLENFLLEHDCKEVKTSIDLLMKDISTYENSASQTDDITVLSCFYSGQSVLASLTISIENQLDNIRLITEGFDTFCEENKISDTPNQKVNLALDDLINNIISYGYKDNKVHTINVAFKRLEDELIIIIEDDAMPFNPFDGGTDNTHLSIDEREIGGLGIHLVKNLMHSCQYQRKANKNIVVLTIPL
ncbi:MAG: serine/threonine protein phosphatase [Sulfurovum sp.]|nr:MAG: serine/threonine protein phosphatase [Sulfurovum sp.]